MLDSKALQVPHPTRLKRWELGFFIWMLKYLCHLYPKDPCEYHRSCCEGEAISPNKCCDFCCPTFLNSQAKGAPPAPSAPPAVCDLALRRCPWFSGDSATFFRRFHRFQLHWLGHSKRRRHGWMRTWHAWLGSQEKDCYVHCYIAATWYTRFIQYLKNNKRRDVRILQTRLFENRRETKQWKTIKLKLKRLP